MVELSSAHCVAVAGTSLEFPTLLVGIHWLVRRMM